MADHRREVLQLIEGAPQPGVDLSEIARQIGVERDRVEALVRELETEGRIRREGDRLVGVGRP